MYDLRTEELVMIYVTTESLEQAKSIANTLVTDRLVACVNILPQITSIYWWQGKVEHATESVMIAKTVRRHVREIIARIKSMHTYDVPCVLVIPIVDGNKDFIEYIVAETQK
jgi:periplasmic divalent cation tolerance protein